MQKISLEINEALSLLDVVIVNGGRFVGLGVDDPEQEGWRQYYLNGKQVVEIIRWLSRWVEETREANTKSKVEEEVLKLHTGIANSHGEFIEEMKMQFNDAIERADVAEAREAKLRRMLREVVAEWRWSCGQTVETTSVWEQAQIALQAAPESEKSNESK